MLEIGTLVDGKYKILRVVGKGGMSVVYQAVNEKANKIWAIKEVRKDGVQNYEIVKQNLIVETELLKRFNHPNLPSIIDVIDETDSFLIVMDYIEGNSLANALEQTGAQSQEDVIEWAKQLCDVLGYLHSRKPPIIYRDMKPSNVMLKPDGQISLIDFGTAREFKSSSVEDTTCLGTQGYAAPEQYGGHGQTDARTDIYCLGTTMYHLLTGHNPSKPPYEMYPIRHWNPLLSSGLEEIIIKCTQKNPEDRYQSCAELLYALEHYQDLDIENKKVQTFKWKTFLVTSIATIVFLVLSLGLKIAALGTSASTYDSYITAAENSDNDNEKIGYYEKAIGYAPNKSDAYIGLIETCFNDFNISPDEYNLIVKYLNTENIAKLQSTDREAFAKDICLNFGDYLMFCYDSNNPNVNSNAGIIKAGKWYKRAKTNTSDENVQKEAEDKYKFTEAKQIKEGSGTGKSPVDYREYWNTLKSIVDSTSKEADKILYSLKCLNFVSSEMYTKNSHLVSKVSKSEYQQLINQIENYVYGIQQDQTFISHSSDDPRYQSFVKSILENLSKVKDDLDALYDSSSIPKVGG